MYYKVRTSKICLIFLRWKKPQINTGSILFTFLFIFKSYIVLYWNPTPDQDSIYLVILDISSFFFKTKVVDVHLFNTDIFSVSDHTDCAVLGSPHFFLVCFTHILLDHYTLLDLRHYGHDGQKTYSLLTPWPLLLGFVCWFYNMKSMIQLMLYSIMYCAMQK